jgi:hypothetical protein
MCGVRQQRQIKNSFARGFNLFYGIVGGEIAMKDRISGKAHLVVD